MNREICTGFFFGGLKNKEKRGQLEAGIGDPAELELYNELRGPYLRYESLYQASLNRARKCPSTEVERVTIRGTGRTRWFRQRSQTHGIIRKTKPSSGQGGTTSAGPNQSSLEPQGLTDSAGSQGVRNPAGHHQSTQPLRSTVSSDHAPKSAGIPSAATVVDKVKDFAADLTARVAPSVENVLERLSIPAGGAPGSLLTGPKIP